MEHFISQYGLWAGLIVFIIWTTLPTAVALIKGLGLGKAAVVTAQANVLNADAQEKIAESETQIGMTRMAFEMLQEQRANSSRNDLLQQSITELKVNLATVTAENKGREESVTHLLTQIGLMEENRQYEKQETERLRGELNTLRGEVETALNKLNAATIAAEAREEENRQLRETNAALEKKEAEYLQRIDELEEKIRLLDQKNQELNKLLQDQNQRIAQLEAEASRSKIEEPAATALPELAS